MITEFGSLCQQNETADDTIESWKMDNVAGSLLANICEMGISSLESRCYGYGVYAKYMERAARAEIRRRLKLMDAIVEGTKNTTLIQTAPHVWDFIQEEEEEEE